MNMATLDKIVLHRFLMLRGVILIRMCRDFHVTVWRSIAIAHDIKAIKLFQKCTFPKFQLIALCVSGIVCTVTAQ